MLHLNIITDRYHSSGSGDYRLGAPPEVVGGHGRFSDPVVDQFAHYRDYAHDGWDGDAAIAISRDAVDAARRLHAQLPRGLERPDIAPGTDGTIGFQWRFARPGGRYIKIFIEVGPGAVIRAYRNHEGAIRHWPQRPVGYGTYRVVSDVFDFLNERGC